MEDNRIEILKNMDISKALTKLAFPAIMGFLVMAIYNIADTIFVSRWSYEGAAAVQVIFPVMMIANAIGLMFGIGGGSYISRLIGENNLKKANSVITSSLLFGVIIAILYAIFSFFLIEDIVKIFGASGNGIELSIIYGKYIIFGAIFVIPSMIFNNALRAEGSAKYSMIGMGVGSIINIILDPIFIFYFKLGIQGAAVATIISQAISCLVLYQFYFRKKTLLKIKLKYFSLQADLYQEILKIGAPTFFKQMLISISMGMFNKSATILGGTYLLSAVSISIKVTIIISYYIFGMGQGLQPLVGYNYGYNNQERVLASQKVALKKTLIGTTIFVTIYFIFAKQIAQIFTTQQEVIDYCIIMIQLLSIAQLFTAVSNTIAVVFQSIGNGKISLFLSILRQGLLFIPAIVIMPKLFGVNGLIASQLVADIFTLLISIIIYLIFFKKEFYKLIQV